MAVAEPDQPPERLVRIQPRALSRRLVSDALPVRAPAGPATSCRAALHGGEQLRPRVEARSKGACAGCAGAVPNADHQPSGVAGAHHATPHSSWPRPAPIASKACPASSAQRSPSAPAGSTTRRRAQACWTPSMPSGPILGVSLSGAADPSGVHCEPCASGDRCVSAVPAGGRRERGKPLQKTRRVPGLSFVAVGGAMNRLLRTVLKRREKS